MRLVVARPLDRRHSLELLSRSVAEVRETVESALLMGREALVGLGVLCSVAEEAMEHVRVRDQALLEEQMRGETAGFMDRDKVRPEPLSAPQDRSGRSRILK